MIRRGASITRRIGKLDGNVFIRMQNVTSVRYSDRHATWEPSDGVRTVQLIGLSDYQSASQNHVVVLRIGRNFFVGFNRKSGINANTREFGDQVTIHYWEGYEDTGRGGVSDLLAHLNQGESYTTENWELSVVEIDLNSNPAVAKISLSNRDVK